MALPSYLHGMLSGVRVLDLTRMLAGPYGSLLLSDLGAEVIKIEQPGEGDTTRTVGKPYLEGLVPYFVSINRNKLSMTLDLTKPRGREVFHELVKHADVVFNNYRPSVLEKLAVDGPTLLRINPRLINCALSGFGRTGPYRDRPAYDLIVQAMGGAMSVTGEKGGDPAVMGLHIGDQAGGMFAAFAIAAALFRRERTGKGEDLDISLLDCQVSLLAFLGQTFIADGAIPGRLGSAHPLIAPFKAFAASDGHVAVVAFQDKHFEKLCRVVGHEELLSDARFATMQKRAEHRDELYALLDAAFEKRTCSEWLAELERAGIPSGPVNDIAAALNDEQVRARGMVLEQDNALGRYEVLGNPIKTSAEEEGRFGPPPALGEHTAEVLSEILGMDESQIAALRAEGAI